MRWAALLLCLAATTLAMAAVTEPAPRYTFATTAAGALRLDTRTGDVALCGGGPGTLACEAVPELRGRVVVSRVAVLQDAADDGCAPHSASMDRVAALADGVMGRLFRMVRHVKRGIHKQGS